MLPFLYFFIIPIIPNHRQETNPFLALCSWLFQNSSRQWNSPTKTQKLRNPWPQFMLPYVMQSNGGTTQSTRKLSTNLFKTVSQQNTNNTNLQMQVLTVSQQQEPNKMQIIKDCGVASDMGNSTCSFCNSSLLASNSHLFHMKLEY